jgi:DNA-binding transcriptional MerR regulator
VSRGGFFTIDEVIETTGFDRRTIAYYVQQGLLPKVGRRGRLTRYPQKVVDRLLFIKLLRDAEESGRRSVPMTLAEIGDALDRIPARELHAVANGIRPFAAADRYLDPHDGVPAEPLASGPPPETWEAALEGPPDLVPRARRQDLMLDETGEPDLFIARMRPDVSLRESRFMMAGDFSLDEDGEPGVHASMGPPSYPVEEPERTGPPDDDLETLLTQLGRLAARRPPDRGAAESWTRVAISPGLELAARDPDHQARTLLDRIAGLLRRRLADSFNRR